MRNNIITAHAGDKTYVKTDPVFQYDYGLILKIDCEELPQEYEVQFGNTNSPANKTVTGDSEGVLVPDEYLRNGEDIHAYLYLHTSENDGFSVYHFHIPVTRRAAIAEEEITPIQHDAIEEALEALAEAVEETEQNVLHYPYINEDKYWMVYDAEHDVFVNTGVKAEGETTFDFEIGNVVTLPSGVPATANVRWVEGVGYLDLGLPIGDTSTFVSIHDERVNQNPVEIHDGADNIAIDDMIIRVEPVQEGSGVPGPRNIRRIVGVSGITMTHVGGGETTEYVTSFEGTAGTIYGGTYYPLTGRLVVDRAFITKRCVDMNNSEVQPGWRDSGIKDIVGENVSQTFTNQMLNIGTSYSVNTVGDNDILYLDYEQYGMRQTEWVNTEITVQICVMLPEPVEYHLDPYIPTAQLGNNTYSVDHGKISYLKYPCDTKKYIDQKIAEVQALALEI